MKRSVFISLSYLAYAIFFFLLGALFVAVACHISDYTPGIIGGVLCLIGCYSLYRCVDGTGTAAETKYTEMLAALANHPPPKSHPGGEFFKLPFDQSLVASLRGYCYAVRPYRFRSDRSQLLLVNGQGIVIARIPEWDIDAFRTVGAWAQDNLQRIDPELL